MCDEGDIDEALALQLALQLSLVEHAAPIAADDPEPAEEPAPESRELWAYAVWGGPGTQGIVGVHTGGRAAWEAISRAIGTYSYRSGHRLRKAPTEREAIAVFEREARKHNVNVPPHVWRH